MKIAVILLISLSISGMSMRDASYFLSHVGSYSRSTTVLLRQAMQLAEVSAPELALVMRQNGSKVSKYAINNYLEGASVPRVPRINEINVNLAVIISDGHVLSADEKAERLTTLNQIFTEVFMTARIESFANANKTRQQYLRLNSKLQESVTKVKHIRSRDVGGNSSERAEQTDEATSYPSEQDFLPLIDSYRQSSIALLHKATEIAGVSFHRLFKQMRKDGEKIGQHSISRILKGERIAADARYLQLQQGLERIITVEMNEQEAQIIIAEIGKIFNKVLTVALPLERYVRDYHHEDFDKIFLKITALRAQAVADYSRDLATTRQAKKLRAPTTNKAIAAARLAADKQRLARYEHSSYYYLHQALALANVQTLSQLQDKDIEVEIFTGNEHVFKRAFDTAPLQKFLQGTGTISSYYVRELTQHLHQQISSISLPIEEKTARHTQLDAVIAAALESLQVEGIVAHNDAIALNLETEFAKVERIKKRDLMSGAPNYTSPSP